jgi:hypothetical protein
MRESGTSSTAQNPSGALGIAQALGHGVAGGGGRFGNEYGGFGLDVAADQLANSGVPEPQIKWMANYMRSAYGGPVGAWNSEVTRGFYDNGGWLNPGATLAFNGTAGREGIITHGQTKAFISMAEAAEQFSRGLGATGASALMRDVYLTLPEGATVADALNEITFRLTVARQQGYAGVMP